MRASEFTEGQIWQGVKQLGKGVGNVLGGAAMLGLRGLDKLGGGTGKIGTPTQQAEFERAKRAKEERKLGNLAALAMREFSMELQSNRVDISQLESLPPDKQSTIKRYLQQWVIPFFTKNINNTFVMNAVHMGLKRLPVPATLSIDSIQQYFNAAYSIREQGLGLNLSNPSAGQPTNVNSQQQTGFDMTSPAGVQIISMPSTTGTTRTNLVVRYRNQDFILMDNPNPNLPDKWATLNGKPLPPALSKFLTDQVSLMTP